MWEPFASLAKPRGTGPLILDNDPTRDGIQALSHSGITNVENYLDGNEAASRCADRSAITSASPSTGDVIWKTDHAITFADAGRLLSDVRQRQAAVREGPQRSRQPGHGGGQSAARAL